MVLEHWSRVLSCNREELRRRFVKAETTLFRVRLEKYDTQEKRKFLQSRDFGWETVRAFVAPLWFSLIGSHKVSEGERNDNIGNLKAASTWFKSGDEDWADKETYYKVRPAVRIFASFTDSYVGEMDPCPRSRGETARVFEGRYGVCAIARAIEFRSARVPNKPHEGFRGVQMTRECDVVLTISR